MIDTPCFASWPWFCPCARCARRQLRLLPAAFRTAHLAFWHHAGGGRYSSFPSLFRDHAPCCKVAACSSLIAGIYTVCNCANFSGRYISTGDEEGGGDDDADADEEEEEVDEEEEEEEGEGEGEAGDAEAPVNGELKLPRSMLVKLATAVQ